MACWNHPFEVARIEAQTRGSLGQETGSMVSVMKDIIKENGVRRFVPRDCSQNRFRHLADVVYGHRGEDSERGIERERFARGFAVQRRTLKKKKKKKKKFAAAALVAIAIYTRRQLIDEIAFLAFVQRSRQRFQAPPRLLLRSKLFRTGVPRWAPSRIRINISPRSLVNHSFPRAFFEKLYRFL